MDKSYSLLDYNTLTTTSNVISAKSPETIFTSGATTYTNTPFLAFYQLLFPSQRRSFGCIQLERSKKKILLQGVFGLRSTEDAQYKGRQLF